MKKKLKSMLKTLIIVMLALSLTGCWNRRELNTLAIVMGVGIDKGEKPDEIEMSVQIVDTSSMKSGSKGGDSGGSSAYINLTGTGTNPISILRNFTHEISRKLYIPHNQMIIFGNGLAKDGVHDSLDMFLRDHEARLTVNVFVAKGEAKAIFKAKPELAKIPTADLSLRSEIQGATSETASLTVMDFMTCLASKTHSAVAPIVDIKENEGKKIAIISGGAVFKADKVVGELDKTETRGFLWVTNKVKSGVLCVGIKGEKADLEIVKSTTDVTAEIKKDGTIHFKVKVKESGSIATQTGSENFGKTENIKLIEKAADELIKQEIKSSIKQAQSLDSDIFGFGEMLHSKYPKQWKTLEGDWDNAFKNINVDIEVEAKIVSAGRLAKPDYPTEE